jgi:chromate transporter
MAAPSRRPAAGSRTSAVLTSADFALALSGFLLLVVWKAPPWIVVVLMATSAILLQLAA